MAPLLPRIGEGHWEKSRATSLGGAGVSTAVVLLIAQIWKANFSLTLSVDAQTKPPVDHSHEHTFSFCQLRDITCDRTSS